MRVADALEGPPPPGRVWGGSPLLGPLEDVEVDADVVADEEGHRVEAPVVSVRVERDPLRDAWRALVARIQQHRRVALGDGTNGVGISGGPQGSKVRN